MASDIYISFSLQYVSSHIKSYMHQNLDGVTESFKNILHRFYEKW